MRSTFAVLALVALCALLLPASVAADTFDDNTMEAGPQAPPVLDAAETLPVLDADLEAIENAESAPAVHGLRSWLEPSGRHAALLMPAASPLLRPVNPSPESGFVFRRNPELTTRADDVLPHPCGGWPGG